MISDFNRKVKCRTAASLAKVSVAYTTLEPILLGCGGRRQFPYCNSGEEAPWWNDDCHSRRLLIGPSNCARRGVGAPTTVWVEPGLRHRSPLSGGSEFAFTARSGRWRAKYSASPYARCKQQWLQITFTPWLPSRRCTEPIAFWCSRQPLSARSHSCCHFPSAFRRPWMLGLAVRTQKGLMPALAPQTKAEAGRQRAQGTGQDMC